MKKTHYAFLSVICFIISVGSFIFSRITDSTNLGVKILIVISILYSCSIFFQLFAKENTNNKILHYIPFLFIGYLLLINLFYFVKITSFLENIILNTLIIASSVFLFSYLIKKYIGKQG